MLDPEAVARLRERLSQFEQIDDGRDIEKVAARLSTLVPPTG